jgi:hypothetical protein
VTIFDHTIDNSLPISVCHALGRGKGEERTRTEVSPHFCPYTLTLLSDSILQNKRILNRIQNLFDRKRNFFINLTRQIDQNHFYLFPTEFIENFIKTHAFIF